jgi:hypothetical protein
MVQEVDSDETLAAPVDSGVEDVTASSDMTTVDSDDEQPFFVISEGEDALGSVAPQPAEEPALEVEPDTTEWAESAAGAAIAPTEEFTELAEEGAGVSEEAPAASEQDPDTNLPEDLRELNDLLDRPTAEIMPITDEAAAAAMAAAGGEGAADETAVAESETAAEALTAEGEVTAETEVAAETDVSAEADATESFDEIAPGTVAEDVVAAEGSEAAAPAIDKSLTTVSWWPFVAYAGVWLLAAGGSAFALQQLPSGQIAYESELYTYVTFGGVALLAAGPILLLATWLVSWLRTDGAKVGSMLISALIKGSSATLFGAALWLGLLLLVDYLRLGRPY